MAFYESIFVFSPKTESQIEEKILTDIVDLFKKEKCKIHIQSNWGKRPLAYLIRKEKEGTYHYFVWEGKSGNVVQKLEQKVKVTDSIIRSFHVRIDEELKRLRKKYLEGMKVNIKGEIRQDGKDKEDIDLLELIYNEPTTIFLREDY